MSRARAVALAALLVVSIFAGVVPMGALGAPGGQSTSNGQGPPSFVDVPGQNTQKSTEVVHPGNPPKHALGNGNAAAVASATSGAPGKSGATAQNQGPPAHVQELLNRVPSKALSNTRVSKHANTTMVDYAATADGKLAVVVTDEVSSEGRTVAIGANVLYRTLGKAPKFATIRHESGETTVETITYSAGYAHIPIEGFSTNTVTFTGEVHLTGDPAVDGTSYQYGLQDLDSVGSYAINVTGDTAYERENQSGQVGDGETIPLSIAGTADPVGPDGESSPDILLEGAETTGSYSTSGGPVAAGDTSTITDLGGNQDSRDASITFEGARSETSRTVSQTGATSSSTKSYDVNGNLLAESEQITLTGTATDTGRATYSLGTYGDGGSDSFSISDLDGVGNPSVGLTGVTNTNTVTKSGSWVSLDHTESISLGGNLQPTDGAGNNPELSVTSQAPTNSYNPIDDMGLGVSNDGNAMGGDFEGNEYQLQQRIDPDFSGPIEDITINIGSGTTSTSGEIDIYIRKGGIDPSDTSGTHLKNWNVDTFPSGETTLTASQTYDVTAGQTYTLSFISSGFGDSTEITVHDANSDAPDGENWRAGWRSGQGTYTYSNPWDIGVGIDRTPPSDVTVTDGDGMSHSFGSFSDGETKTANLNFDTSSTEIDLSADGDGWLDYSFTAVERTATEDPTITLNGDQYSHAGTLSSGQTASLTPDSSSFAEGTNNVDVSLPSTSGPAMEVEINSVEYDDLQYTEDPAVDVDGDGTTDVSYTGDLPTGQTHSESVDLAPGSYIADPSVSTGTVDWHVDFTEVTGVENPSVDVGNDGTVDATYTGVLDAGENATETISDGTLSTGSNTLAFDQYAGPAYNFGLEATEVTHTEDPDVDVDGDGTYEVTHTGILDPGSAVSYDVPELTLMSSELAIVTNGGSEVIAEAQYRERTQTEDVTVSVNGNPTSYDLTLDDGKTHSLAVNESWLVNGTNTVEISVASSLGSDAPDGQVGFDYYHTAEDHVETTYEGETWTERYNVSKTWANSKENATLTIPFDSSKVVGIRDVEQSVNGSVPTPVDRVNYSLEDTTLTVDLGDVQEGETIAVQANGTKVNVGNGDITVTDPTIEGNALDTSFRIDRHDPGFYMELSGTATPDRVHHLETLSWTGANPYTEHNADGTQFLYLPNATAGGEATMQTLPLDVDPKTGDVHIALEDDNASNPVFEVEPGDQLGDEVEFVWHNTTSGETYVLDSRTNGIARDTQEAESPVTLLDDDSPEVLEIYEEDQEATGDGDPSGGDTQYISPVESTRAWYESLPIISIGAALALAVVAAIANYLFREWYKILGTVGAAALVELVLLTEFIWPEVILSPLATGIREIAPTIAFILAVTIAYVIYNRWGTITDSGNEDAVTVSDDGVLRLRRK